MKHISFDSKLNSFMDTLKEFYHHGLTHPEVHGKENNNSYHTFSFLDQDNPYDLSSLHWDEYGNPFIYLGDNKKAN